MDPRIFAGAPSGLKNSFGLNVLSNIPVYQYFSVKNVRFGLLWVRARPANRFSIAVALWSACTLSLKEINPKPRVTAGVSTIKKKGPLSAVHRFNCASKQISCNRFEVTSHHIKSLQFGVLLKKVLTHYSKKTLLFWYKEKRKFSCQLFIMLL